MSTFLQQVRLLRNKCSGIGGSSGQPATTVGQIGDMGNMVDWVRESWVDLQAQRTDWLFMRDEFTVTKAAGDRVVTAADAGLTNLASWYDDTLRVYRSSEGVAGDGFLIPWDHDVFRDTYMFGQQTPGKPVVFAVRPRDKALLLGPVPDTEVVVYGEYQRSPQIYGADDDVPRGLPEHFHNLIVYHAMTKYAGNWAAPEVMVDAMNQKEALMHRLVQDWTPAITHGGTLA